MRSDEISNFLKAHPFHVIKGTTCMNDKDKSYFHFFEKNFQDAKSEFSFENFPNPLVNDMALILFG